MKKQKAIGLDFIIDKLTNSIENVVTGDSFPTEISVFTTQDLKSVNKKNRWLFDWKSEFKNPKRDVYKLTIWNNPAIIQGLICLEVKEDHVWEMFLSFQRHNLSTTMRRHLVRSILVEG